MNFVTVASFDNILDLTHARNLLEDQEIMCFTMDEHTIQINPLFGPMLGYMKLQVPETDVAEAKRLLTGAGLLK